MLRIAPQDEDGAEAGGIQRPTYTVHGLDSFGAIPVGSKVDRFARDLADAAISAEQRRRWR
jgi:hypothetical protein